MGTTRRELMATAALGSAWLLTGCGGDPAPRPVPRGAAADLEALTKLLELERRVAQVYEQLAGALPAAARAFGEHEAEHALALEQAMRDLGATPPAPVPVSLPRLGRDQVTTFVSGLENTSIAAYLGSIPRVSSGDLRATLAAALTVDAEHVAVLSGSAGAALIGGDA